jgi:hypothetical protein
MDSFRLSQYYETQVEVTGIIFIQQNSSYCLGNSSNGDTDNSEDENDSFVVGDDYVSYDSGFSSQENTWKRNDDLSTEYKQVLPTLF